MMSEMITTKQWTCECSTVNPLWKRQCTKCGLYIPKYYLNKIFNEEVRLQKDFFKKQRFDKKVQMCQKFRKNLPKLKIGVFVLCIIAIIGGSAARIFFYPASIKDNSYNYFDTRIERVIEEKNIVAYRLSYLIKLPKKMPINIQKKVPIKIPKKTPIKIPKKIPMIIKEIPLCIEKSVKNTWMDVSENSQQPEALIVEEKIKHIIKKIKDGKNYVTNLFG